MITTSERNYLLSSMKELLSEYDYPTTDAALNTIIDQWAANKKTLIEAFKKHPQYKDGMFMIAFDSDYERVLDTNGSKVFSEWIREYAIGPGKRTLPAEVLARTSWIDSLPNDLWYFFIDLYKYAERCISEETAELLNRIAPEVHAHAGEKTSRAVNRLCCYLNYDKIPGYNKAFAKYADSLSPMTIKRHTVLSLNPLDYLTMSFGNSWASCHTIDKTNKRDMPNSYHGQYSSGTMSYMLDESSMVMYTLDGSYDGNVYWDEPKITRQMFHWGEDKLIQGRLYPQENDCCGGEYTIYRNIVQQIMSVIFDFPNFWRLKRGVNECVECTTTHGTHYADYLNFNSCNVSYIKGVENTKRISIGAVPICPKCGQTHEIEDNISCCGGGGIYYCSRCGEDVYGDNVIEIDGRYYCRDCVHLCDRCGRYHVEDIYYIESERTEICRSCYEDNYVWCRERNQHIRIEDAVLESGRYIHRDDVHARRARCAHCGNEHLVRRMRNIGGELYCHDCYWWI